MTLSKRDAELNLFNQIQRAAAGGGGTALLISGPVGSGKTALLQEMAARADCDGWSFVVIGSALERGNPFGVLDHLIRLMRRSGMADPVAGGVGDDEDFFSMMDRVSAAVREFAGDRPIFIGVDDVHFADAQSLRCLSYLIRRIESSGVVMVLTESTSYERDMADLRADMLHLAFCHRVRLAPLTSAAIAQQWRERLGGDPVRASVKFCAQVTGGVPLLLHALLDDLAAGPDSLPGEPGNHFRQAVLRSMHRCAPETAAVAQAFAVLGDHAAPELIAQLSGVESGLVPECVRDLREMGLLGQSGFRHVQTRSALLAGVSSPNLPEMRGRAAELLYESGAPATAIAEQLIVARDGGKAPWRVAILREAAREALNAGDVDSAVSSLRHAVAASSDEVQRARAAVLLTEAQWNAGPSRAVRRLGQLGRDARAGLLTGPGILFAVNHSLWWGEFAEADALLRLTGDGGDSALTQLWSFFSRAGWGPGAGEDRSRPADSPLAQSGPMAAAAYLSSAASLALHEGPVDRADETLLGLRSGAALTPALYALVGLVQAGRSSEAIAWCDRLLKKEWIDRVPMRRAMIGTIESVVLLSAGNSATALSRIREVLGTVPPSAWGVVAGLPLSVAVRAGTDGGDTDAARSYLAVPVPPAMFDTPFAVPYLLALGAYHAAMGHPESALAHNQSSLELLSRWGIGGSWISARPDGLMVAPPAAAAESDDPLTAGGRTAALAPPRADDGVRLTDAEERVASLAAAGNTNRQIAERLFITVSTVEQHLTKIYRKLNLRSRSGLRRYSC